MILPTLWNSIFITVVGTAINILLTTSAAYVLIQPGLMFKKIIMTFLIVMMLFDPGLVPEYLLVKQLGLIGSQWSVILVTSVNVYYLITVSYTHLAEGGVAVGGVQRFQKRSVVLKAGDEPLHGLMSRCGKPLLQPQRDGAHLLPQPV